MVTLKMQKRLASDILKCGRARVWMDPNEIAEIKMANSRSGIRKLVKDGYIIKKPVRLTSSWRWKKRQIAKAKGRHRGHGHRQGSANARMPTRILWMRRIRCLRKLIRRYREIKKINKHMYRRLYLKIKGNVFKSRKALMEFIFKSIAQRKKARELAEEVRAKKQAIQAKDAERKAKKKKKISKEMEARKKLTKEAARNEAKSTDKKPTTKKATTTTTKATKKGDDKKSAKKDEKKKTNNHPRKEGRS